MAPSCLSDTLTLKDKFNKSVFAMLLPLRTLNWLPLTSTRSIIRLPKESVTPLLDSMILNESSSADESGSAAVNVPRIVSLAM